jgi:hypothetical protein
MPRFAGSHVRRDGEKFQGGWLQPWFEYLYVDLGTVSGGPFVTGIAPPVRASFVNGAFSSRVTDNILRVGVNRKF